MAEARSAVSEPRVGRIEEGRSARQDFLLALRASVIRRFFRTRNLIKNGMWPTKWWNLVVVVLALTALLLLDWPVMRPLTDRLLALQHWLPIPEDWPVSIRSCLVSVVAGFCFFIVWLHVRRYLLRILLSYHGWMYEQPKTQGVSTLVWGCLVKVVSGSHPSLYGCQQSLPRLPVPPLKDTLKKLIQSLKPLYGENSQILQELKQESKEFQKTIGPKLQRILYLKSWWSQNYVTDFWEKYVYLMGRNPLPINSNYYVMDQYDYCPTHSQIARAANVMYQINLVKQKIDREQIDPLLLRGTIPVCMAQYERVFSTTRIPGLEMDHLAHFDSSVSKHVAVLRKGVYYKMDVYDKNRRLIAPDKLQKQLYWIMKDSEKHADSYSDQARSLPALTGMNRTWWAQVRGKYFKTGVNAESLDIVEKSLYCVVLGDQTNKDLSTRAQYLFYGDKKSIWFDKSFNLVVSPDGRMGLNCEHSFADAPVIANMLEYNLTQEAVGGLLYEPVDLSGVDLDTLHDANGSPDSVLSRPQRLVWDVPTNLCNDVDIACRNMQQAVDDIDLRVEGFFTYGKGFIKTCKVSPDAYIQMALQVTYYKNAGKHCLTYESSMTRLYLMGRTETVRSLTSEAAQFVKAFLDQSVCKAEKIGLLQRACDNHVLMYKESMDGSGIDRHLFALYVVSKGLDYNCEFLKKCLSIPWTLSTSQSPQQQLASSPSCDVPQYRDKVSPGGGFGPVSDDGYGIAYMITGDYKIFFHVSSKRSSKCTDSSLFMQQLFETLCEMKALFEEDGASTKDKA